MKKQNKDDLSFENKVWAKFAENWFKLLEWTTILAIFSLVSKLTNNKLIEFIHLISYSVLWYYLYCKALNLKWGIKSKRLVSIISLLITIGIFIAISEATTVIKGKF